MYHSKSMEVVVSALVNSEKVTIKELPARPYGENSRHLLDHSGKAVFPMKYFDPNKSYEEMLDTFNEALASGQEKYVWDYTYSA